MPNERRAAGEHDRNHADRSDKIRRGEIDPPCLQLVELRHLRQGDDRSGDAAIFAGRMRPNAFREELVAAAATIGRRSGNISAHRRSACVRVVRLERRSPALARGCRAAQRARQVDRTSAARESPPVRRLHPAPERTRLVRDDAKSARRRASRSSPPSRRRRVWQSNSRRRTIKRSSDFCAAKR